MSSEWYCTVLYTEHSVYVLGCVFFSLLLLYLSSICFLIIRQMKLESSIIWWALSAPMTNILFSLFNNNMNLTTTQHTTWNGKFRNRIWLRRRGASEKKLKNNFIGDMKTNMNRLKLLQKAEFFSPPLFFFPAVGLTPFSKVLSGVTQKEIPFVTVLYPKPEM